MALRPLVGHEAVRARLAESIHRGRLPASLLLVGPVGIGKQRLALWLAQMRLCERVVDDALVEPCGACQQCRYSMRLTHPDLHWFFPRPRLRDADASVQDVSSDLAEAIAERIDEDGIWATAPGTDGLYLATIRALVQQASLRPAMARHGVFVVGDCERMVSQEGALQAANAFLKLLEEPPSYATIVMTTSEPGALIPTIRSRVVQIRVPPLTPSQTSEFLSDPLVAKRVQLSGVSDPAAFANGAPGRLFSTQSSTAAIAGARAIMGAVLDDGPAGVEARIKVAARQGVAGARGAFSDTLDALTVLLHERTKQLAHRGDDTRARRASSAMPLLEQAKLRASGNVSPQLLAAHLVTRLHRCLR